MRTTYAPPVRPDQLPATRGDWLRRAGLTDPAVIALAVQRRISAAPREFRYEDFFHTP